ncbi:hydrogenase 4 subunit B [Bisgaard Taxon 45]
MSDSIILLLLSLAIYTIGAFTSLIWRKQEKPSIYIAGISSIIGGGLGVASSLAVLFNGGVESHTVSTPYAFANYVIYLDGLSAFMVFVISLLVIVSAIYSLDYVKEYIGKGAGSMGFFMNLFIASMIAVVTVDNAFWFLVFFELMSLASYFLVLTEQDKKAINAGLLYFFIAHAGSVFIMIAFFLCYRETGSLDFDTFRQANFSPITAFTVFVLAFLGFGAKAGMVPLHGWLPQAHPAAPSHASALMSGVMVKIGIFGIIKVGVDILHSTNLWFGVIVLSVGAISSVLGVLYAIAEHDIKRLLAYHTVENVGIIMMGVGVGMIGMAINQPTLAAIGFLGGLYHLLNHAVFKGLLFLGAGSIMYRLHTKDMDLMGGLGKLMPYTALCFLIGTMAISALPPFNGFVSEWFTYQSLFSLSHSEHTILHILGPIAIVMLALTGALAALCFVKVYGISFSGAPRSEKAAQATEVPKTMWFAMGILAGLCILLGIGASLIAPIILNVSASLAQTQSFVIAEKGMVLSGENATTLLSTPMLAIMLLACITLPFIYYACTKPSRLPDQNKGTPWACGYEYERKMSLSSSNFTRPLRVMFKPLYLLRQRLSVSELSQRVIAQSISLSSKVEPIWEENITMPTANKIPYLAEKIRWLQQGDFRVYCLYFVITLVVLLFSLTILK